MKFFDKWLYKKLRDMWENNEKYDEAMRFDSRINKMSLVGSQAISVERNSIDANGFNLKVFRANGGTIIETRRYEMKTDRQTNGLYVITDDKDLGVEIGKIITMEGLKA